MHTRLTVLESTFLVCILGSAFVVGCFFPREAHATKYAGEFLRIGVGARAIGMGGAFTAVSDDASASFWNPAGLVFLDRPRLMATHAEQFGQLLKHDYAAGVLPMGRTGVMSGSVVIMAIDDIPDTRGLAWDDAGGCDGDPTTADSCQNNGVYDKGETIYYDDGRIFWRSDTEMAILVSYARWVAGGLSLGGNVKFIHQSLMGHSSNGVGIDVGAIYSPHKKLSIGVKVSDLSGTRLAWDTGVKDIIAPRMFLGVQYIGSLWGNPYYMAQDVYLDFEGETLQSDLSFGDVTGELHTGFEIWLKKQVALRIGLSAGDLSAGAGFRLGMSGVDYAFLAHEALGSSHRISASMSF